MESLDEVLLDNEDKMSKALDFLQQKFAGLRTGKASPSLVENVQVMYYGTQTRLRDLAGIATPEPRLIVINAYDPTALGAIEKAILAANLGLTPMNDGRVIRLPIPELSQERRQEIIKVAKRETEEQRVAVRNLRREANDAVKALQKKSVITEDERDKALDDIQKNTDAYIKKMDGLLSAKEKEIQEV
ncbi:MAG: ribosome recycling factor [Kiritimatiellae bacterium]|nr:ribosome recycling factor [Kiritimatiellia bacterium]MDD4734856.1 ribosome recycling factor [Kiritimatiellia bacterium]